METGARTETWVERLVKWYGVGKVVTSGHENGEGRGPYGKD